MKLDNNILENGCQGIGTPMFSIIVPVYNVADYIEKTVESIMAQSFGYYELILVDDGSTDGSGSFIDSVAESDNRVKAFHQHNSGVSAARNLGLEKSRGEWIVFVDGDDALKPDALQVLADYITQYPEADLIGYGFESVDNLNYINESESSPAHETLYDCRETICSGALNHYMVWGETFKRDILGDLRFINLKNGEDVLFCNSLACRTHVYLEIDAKIYLYLQREASAKLNAWTERRFEDYSVMNALMLKNIQSCNRNLDRAWLRRWSGNLLQFLPEIWSQTDYVRRRCFNRHFALLKKAKKIKGLPAYIKLWIVAATTFNSQSVYRIIAMWPMKIYSIIINH